MFRRPNLNAVVDSILNTLPDPLRFPVRIYLMMENTGHWWVDTEADAGVFFTSSIVGGRDRKFIRIVAQELLDELEEKYNDRKKDRSVGSSRRVLGSDSNSDREDY